MTLSPTSWPGAANGGGGIPQGGPLTADLDADGQRLIDLAQLRQVAESLAVAISHDAGTTFAVTDFFEAIDLLNITNGAVALSNFDGTQYFAGGANNLDLSTPSAAGRLTLDDFAGNDLLKILNGAKLGFFGAAPAVQPTAIANVAGGAVQDAEARTALNSLLAACRTLGLIAT